MDKEKFNQIVIDAQQGNQEAFERLVLEAKPLLLSLAKQFSGFHSKLEFEDLYNIAMYSLYKTVQSFNPKNPSFLHQAKLIIMRDLISEVRTLQSKKRSIFEVCTIDEMPKVLSYDDISTVEEKVFLNEIMNNVRDVVDKKVTKTNQQIFKLYLKGYNNKQIANMVGNVTSKQVSTSIYRTKQKIIENKNLIIKEL